MGFSFLQPLALVLMLVDHLALWVFPGEVASLLRDTLGRGAMPAFAAMVAWHAWSVVDPWRYARRCFLVAILAEPWFVLLHGVLWGNIVFTFASALLVVACWRTAPRWLPLAVLLALAVAPWVEYGLPGLFLVVGFLVASRHPVGWLLVLVWPFLQYVEPLPLLASYVWLALIATLWHLPMALPRLPRWLTRGFYPAHLAVIFLLVLD